MNFLIKKEIENIPTPIYEKSIKCIFLSLGNQKHVTKEIYQTHKYNQGRLDYLYFKKVVPERMVKWIIEMPVANDEYTVDRVDVVIFLNRKFIKQNSDLYEYKTTDKNVGVIPDTNVYRGHAVIGSCDENNILSVKKVNYKDLLASDYGSIDVWKETSTSMSSDMIMAPSQKRFVNLRHYDSSNEGYCDALENATIDNFTRGYGSNYKDVIDRNEELYKKYTS